MGGIRSEPLVAVALALEPYEPLVTALQNARAFLEVQQERGSFSEYIWDFVDNEPIQNRWISMQEVPATSEISERLSKDMKKRGFTFVGSTIMYAYMQATGIVNDHTTECFRYKHCANES